MALTVGEGLAVFAVARLLTRTAGPSGGPTPDADAHEALQLLLRGAGRALKVSPAELEQAWTAGPPPITATQQHVGRQLTELADSGTLPAAVAARLRAAAATLTDSGTAPAADGAL